jgi:hypothetical protein
MSNDPSSEKRLSGWKKALLALGALVIGLGMILVAIDLVGRSALQTQLDIIRAAGDPLTFEELEARREPLPDDRNGALLLVTLVTQLATAGKDAPKKLPFLGDGQLPPPGEPYDADVVAASRTLMAHYTDLVLALDDMLKRPAGRFRSESPDALSFTGSAERRDAVRTAAKLKALGGLLRALDGDAEGAARDAERILNIAASLDEGCFIPDTMVVAGADATGVWLSEQALSMGVLPDGMLDHLNTRFEDREASRALVWTAWGERVFQSALFGAMRGAPTGVAAKQLAAPTSVPVFLSGWVMRDEAHVLSIMHQFAQVAKDPLRESGTLIKVEQDAAALSWVYQSTRATLSGATSAVHLWVRHIAELRCGRTALAVERFRLRHAGWPESLDVLVPDFLDAVPTDPFDGQLLRYKLTDEKVTIYSVGENQRDDGGDVRSPNRGRAPDLGFRLLRPDLRMVRIRENTDTQPSDANSSGQ